MFALKVKSKNGDEQSDFATSEEALAYFERLRDSGYYGETHTHEIVEIIKEKEDISPRQLRLALLSLGITEELIDSLIATLPSPQKEQAKIAWKHSLSYRRNEVAVGMIGLMAGLSVEQLDALWVLAKDL